MVAFKLPGTARVDVEKAWNHFRQVEGFEVSFPKLTDGTPLLRVSNAWFNTREELEALAQDGDRSVKQLAKRALAESSAP